MRAFVVAVFLQALTAIASACLSPLPVGHAAAPHFNAHIARQAKDSTSTATTTPTVTTLVSPHSLDLDQSPSTISPVSTLTSAPSAFSDINTIFNRRVPYIVASVDKPLKSWISNLGSDGKWPSSAVDYTTGCDAQRANWPALEHWRRIVSMAAAYHGGLDGAGSWVGSPQVFDAISKAMNFWFENDYNVEACLYQGGQSTCPCGTPGFWNSNWFSNVIGVPSLVGQTCLLLAKSLTPTQLSNCTRISGRSYEIFWQPTNDALSDILTGANVLDISRVGIDLALYTVNTTLLQDAYSRVHGEITVQPTVKADGIKPDGSFGQHAGVIYNGNYGKDFTNDVMAFEIEAGGTPHQANNMSKTAFENLIGGNQWMMYKNVLTGVLHWDFSVVGRFISSPVADNQATGSININMTQVKVLGDEWSSEMLLNAYANLISDTVDANIGNITGNRVFYNNDYVVQRGPGYVTTLQMYSNRTRNTECLNSQNPYGFHLSDGTVYTYLSGSEYEDISGAWDWNMIPGTTVDYAGTKLSCDHAGYDGSEVFVGAASTGTIGLAAMRYRNPYTHALEWQKAWAFVNGDVQHVMVSNIVQHAKGQKRGSLPPVYSVLDQRTHDGDVFVDGKSLDDGGNFTSPLSLWHAGVGYLFTNSGQNNATGSSSLQLSVDMGKRSTDWSAIGVSQQPSSSVDLYSAWLVHSAESSQGTGSDKSQNLSRVSYSVFPATPSYSDFMQKSQKTNLVEVRNDESVSALYNTRGSTRTAYVVFWDEQGGSVDLSSGGEDSQSISVASNIGLLVIVEKKNTGGWCVIVADPTQVATTAVITLSIGGGKSQEVNFNLPRNGLAGSSLKHCSGTTTTISLANSG